MTQSEKLISQEAEKKSMNYSPAKQLTELEDDYIVQSQIANSKSMQIIEGYPTIKKTIFDLDHTDPDESEYCIGDSRDLDEHDINLDKSVSALSEGYATRHKKKNRYGYEY